MAGRADTLKQTVSTSTQTTTQAKPSKAPAEVTPQSREERLAAWAQANARPLAIGAGVIALVALVGWFVMASGKRKEAFARQALENAWGAADAGNIPQASSELQKVANTYKGTDAAYEATLSLNQTRLSAGQSQLAVDDLRRFLQAGPPARFVHPANMLLGAGLENLGKPAEAADAYMAASSGADMDHLKAEALLAAGRAYRAAGQNEKAIAAYQSIVDHYQTTAAFPVAEVRLGELKK
jgi:predicted negative regulator of RcsB-dependent stress response